jgi:hypothetical protein
MFCYFFKPFFNFKNVNSPSLLVLLTFQKNTPQYAEKVRVAVGGKINFGLTTFTRILL